MLAGAAADMTLHACSAGDTTWALGFADVGDPARIAPALSELGAAAMRNVNAAAVQGRPLDVPGMTPNPQSRRLSFAGTRPDGTAVHIHVGVFSKGTWVFQATVVGPEPPAEAVETFFAALRIAS
jgi:hypothetical protein